MKNLNDLTKDELVSLVEVLRNALFVVPAKDLEEEEVGTSTAKFFFDPDKEWDSSTLDSIAEKMVDLGLVPEDISPVEG